MGKYRYRLSCPDCMGIDPLGCFGGGTQISEETFDTVQQVIEAAWNATLRTIYDFDIVDEDGNVLDVDVEKE